MRVKSGWRDSDIPHRHDLPCPAPHGYPQGGVRVGCAMMILVRLFACAYAFQRMSPQGHQPRQPVRRGSQHPKFTELVIYNSASFLSDLTARLCTADRWGRIFHVSVMVSLYHRLFRLSINLWFISGRNVEVVDKRVICSGSPAICLMKNPNRIFYTGRIHEGGILLSGL